MIASMTAYAQYETKNILGNIIWEIKSLNQRYLDIDIYLPKKFYMLENIVRERLKCRVHRGKISCFLHIEEKKENNFNDDITFDKFLAKRLVMLSKTIEKKLGKNFGKINSFDILKWPGVITKKKNSSDINQTLLAALDTVLNNFIVSRKKEGQTLGIIIKKQLEEIEIETKKIRQDIPDILKKQKEVFLLKIKDMNIEFDSHRLEQEIFILAQRMDILEELDRLDIHVKNAHYLLSSKQEVIGRNFDFLIQECIRESNTIASKSTSILVKNSAIKLKVLIEQIREQIQNIE